MYRRTMGVLAALAVGWAPMAAGATTLTNASKEKAKVSIEKWIRFIDGESTVEFLPVELPATIYVQFPMASLDCDIPWRIYRPGMVVGDSTTGEIDKIDGIYYVFKLLQKLRQALPPWVPLVGLEGGKFNIVPVDYVADAMDHIAHAEGEDGNNGANGDSARAVGLPSAERSA